MRNDDLHDAVDSLRDEVRLLRQVLDEVREELSWANNNAQDIPAGNGAASTIRLITSMSADPTARDFHVNSVSDEMVAQLRQEAGDKTSATTQPTLF